MNYQNYEASIKSRYKVHLVGWPPHIPFANPSTISTEHLQRLSDALESFHCRWERMTREEVIAHVTQQDVQHASEVATKPGRKTRSDKGKKRSLNVNGQGPTKRRKAGETSTVGEAPKKRTRVAKQLPPRSAEFIESDEDSLFEQDAAALPADTIPVTTVFPTATAPAVTAPVTTATSTVAIPVSANVSASVGNIVA